MAYRMAEIVDGAIVRCVVAADPLDFPEMVDVTEIEVDEKPPSVGWLYDGQTFSPPVTEEPPSPPALPYKRYTYAEFIDAVTRTEYLAFLTKAKTDPLIEMFYEIAKARQYVDFNDPETLASVPYLIVAEIIVDTPERTAQQRLAELTG